MNNSQGGGRMDINGASIRGRALKVCLVLLFAFGFTRTSFGDERRSTETEGTVGFTGIYKPVDQPEPSPPTGPVPLPPQDTGKPGGQLPQTNFIQRLDWVILGSLLLITALNIYVVKQLIKKGKSTFPKWG
ncbi:MAG: hypothetical protein E7152_01015 [Enterococcus casseliflavus]|nr:hypothetical protein [Enterococcus casseliflavus]